VQNIDILRKFKSYLFNLQSTIFWLHLQRLCSLLIYGN